MLGISYHFGYLVMAQRSLKNITEANPSNNTPWATPSILKDGNISPIRPINVDRKRYIQFSIEHATKLLQTLPRLPPSTGEVIPDHLMLTVTYSILILVACFEDSEHKEETSRTIHKAISYCKEVGISPIGAAEFAAAKLDRMRSQNNISTMESQPQQEICSDFYQDFSIYAQQGFGGLEFPSLEDLFSDAFGTCATEDDQGFY